jgi:hypothetical protein
VASIKAQLDRNIPSNETNNGLGNLSRKSISMESVLQSNNVEELINKFQEKSQAKVNNINKFGTIGGYSSSSSCNPGSNSGSVGKNQRSVLPISFRNDEIPALADGAQHLSAQSTSTSSRLRAINRSFRTAVDKSFDVVPPNGKFCSQKITIFSF